MAAAQLNIFNHGKTPVSARSAWSEFRAAHFPEVAGRQAAAVSRWWAWVKYWEKENSGVVGCKHGARTSLAVFLLFKAALGVKAIEQP